MGLRETGPIVRLMRQNLGRTDEPGLCGASTHAPDLSAKQHFLVSARTSLLRRVKGAIDYADNAEYFIWAKEASMSHPLGLSRARP